VKRAQIEVLDKVSEILTGNCKSAADGNYNCAKFVLDWSGVSDIRTPLAKAPHKKSVTSMLLKRLNEVAEQQEKEEPETAR
jgi:hypothetical protein